MQLLSSPSTATKYAAAMIIREIGSSTQAVKQYGLRTSIANGLANCIHEITFSRHVYVDDQLQGELDDILFATLVRVTADNPQEIYSEDAIAESWLALTGLRELGVNPLGALGQLGDLRNLQAQATKMQSALQDENIVLQKPGITVYMSGDQKIQRLELDGVNNERLVEILNELIEQTQELAAKTLIEISSHPVKENPPYEDEEELSIPGLQGLQRQAQRMQARLQEELIEVEKNNMKIVTRGDQFIETIEIGGKEYIGLVDALNEAMKQSQEMAAHKLIEISSKSENEAGLENRQEDVSSIFDSIQKALQAQEYQHQLQQLQAQATKMQSALQDENIVLQKPGITVYMSGDQKIQRLELDGVNNEKLVEILNESIEQTRELAAKTLIEISSHPVKENPPYEDEEELSIPGLQGLQRQAQRMQARLQEELIEVEKNNMKIVTRGDQFIETIEIGGKEYIGLVDALNEAMKQSQEMAAHKLIEISGLESDSGDQEKEQDVPDLTSDE